LPLQGVKCVISALPQHAVSLTHENAHLMLLDALHRQHYAGKIAIALQQSNDAEDVDRLKRRGADLIFQPFHDAATQAAEQLKALLATKE